MSRFIILGLAVFLAMLTATVSAAKPHSAQVTGTRLEIQNPVEQQTPGGETQPDISLWVINDTGCPWDGDDRSWARLTGYLDDNVSHDLCVISDWSAHLTAVEVCVRKHAQKLPAMRVSIDFSTGHHVETGTYISETKQKGCMKVCMTTPDYDHQSPYLQPIPGSNGGVGVPMDATFTVENLSGRRLREFEMNTFVIFNSNRQQDAKCPGGHWIDDCEGIDPRVCWSRMEA